MSKVGGLDDTIWMARPPPEDRLPPRSRANRISLVVVLAVIGIGVVGAILALFSAKDYGTPAFWSLPKHVNYCGREYLDQGAQSGNPSIFKSQDSAKDARWTFLSWTFGARSIYAVVAPLHPPADVICTTVLYVPTGDSQWETYALSGGP